ncbi:CPBP family intramembrane glutamic endopeptidase [Kitasatospora sp. NPDC057015]|uniref:CPBP family intramembrane glutamic endopeptidase n=1 Tax=Kitasatospora sp. NPDC057015 TaxID=3346001 RepID=UPI003636A4D5
MRRGSSGPAPGQISVRTGVAVTVLVLVLVNVLNNRLAPGAYLVTAPLTAALLLVVLRLAGGTWADAGLDRGSWGRGARWAAALIGLVAAGYLAAALLPQTRELFTDRRTEGDSAATVAFQVLVRIPLGTVLLEEVAFRGVLYGLLRKEWDVRVATIGSSLLFGLWHVLPSLHLSEDKPALTPLFGHSAVGVVVVELGTVLFTGLAGVLFCELRRRSGSLLAPAGLHWATNALGILTGFALNALT